MNEEPVPLEVIQEEEIQEPLQEKPRSKLRLWLAGCGGLVLLCVTLFVGTLVIAGPKFVQKYIPEKISLSKILPPLLVQVNTIGDPNAPVHIIEYGDYQCPYCLEFWNESEALLIEEYVNTGKVYFEYRSFGAYLGPESGLAAEGSYCAGD
ncbi:MAG: thioredoxin domain-containing protein [Chloroflexi bacterium]|nr:thioredoxin domain-containing protein [Chloroflexota bacterium]